MYKEGKLSLIESLILMERQAKIGDLKYLRNYIIRKYNENSLDGMGVRLMMTSQIYFLLNGIHGKKPNFGFRKRVLC